MRLLAPAGTVVELIVQVERCVDERQVAERLREVAKLLARQPDLLRVETGVVGGRAMTLRRSMSRNGNSTTNVGSYKGCHLQVADVWVAIHHNVLSVDIVVFRVHRTFVLLRSVLQESSDRLVIYSLPSVGGSRILPHHTC